MVSHYDSGLVCVQLPSGSQRTFLQEQLYLPTGQEKPPLPEETPDCRRASKRILQLAMTACGNELRASVKHNTQLESPELNAAWHELGFRCEVAGEEWPNRLFVRLNITEMDYRLTEWAKAPGSPESQINLQQTRRELAAVLLEETKAACVQVPLYGGGHWTLLTLRRAATPEGQAAAEKLVVEYRDALRQPSAACLQKAHVALSFLVSAIGSACVANHVLPPIADCFKQTDLTSCGYFVMNWLEEDFRLFRGEGVRVLPVTFVNRAAALSRWFKRVCAVSKQTKEAAKAKAVQAALAKDPSPAPAPLADASAPASAAEPLPLAGPPVSVSETFGCSRCKNSKGGCLSCNPAKMAKWADKKKAEQAAEAASQAAQPQPDEPADKWAAFELPAGKRRKRR